MRRSALQPVNIRVQADEAHALDLVRRSAPLSRTDLADHIGYSRAKITTLINSLIHQGILIETGSGESTGGRRPRMLNFNPKFGYVAGIDLGATSLDIALADFSGAILQRHAAPIDVRDGAAAVLILIRDKLIEMLETHHIPRDRFFSIGLGVPGPVDFAAGMLIAPPIMPGWDRYPIRDFFRDPFPQTRVIVDNDVNVMALGEQRAGLGVGVENFFFVKIGTGIGCGIVCMHQVYRGSSGCAGDIGHICVDRGGTVCHCGNIGCLEAMAAGPPIAQRARTAAEAGESPILQRLLNASGTLTAEDVGSAAAQGDPVASHIIIDSGRMIGEVLASLVNFYNPSLIVIGGGVSKIGDRFLAAIRRAVLTRSLPLSTRHLRIDNSVTGTDAGVIGAIALALEHVFTVTR